MHGQVHQKDTVCIGERDDYANIFDFIDVGKCKDKKNYYEKAV